MSKSILALFSTIALIIGCEANNVNVDQCEGTWQIKQSDGGGVGYTATSTVLTLRNDGSFVAISLPPRFFRFDGIKPDQVHSGRGRWSLTPRDSGRQVRLRLTFSRVDDYDGQYLPYSAELFIQRSGTEIQLFYFEGDPDENRRVSFERKSKEG